MENSKKIYIMFIMLSLIFGITFSILIPLYQVPDEETHLNYIYSYLENDDSDFIEETDYYGDTSRIVKNYEEKVNKSNYFDLSKKINIIDKIDHFDIHIIRYLPQTIGLLISELFNFPIIIAITFAEVLAVIFYTFTCLKALKLMPIKKEFFMAIMLLPIAVQQMGSFSYDMMLNCFSFLFIAYVLKLKFDDKKINNKNIIIIILLLALISFIKIPYIFLGGLLFLIPLNKYDCYDKIKSLIKRRKKTCIFALSLVLILLGFIFYKYLFNLNYVKVIIAFIINPINGVILIAKTIINHIFFYAISTVGYFGWHDTPVSILFAFFIVISFIIINILSSTKVTNNAISNKEKLFLLIYTLLFFIVIIISMFDWTLYYLGTDTSNFSILNYSNQISNLNEILGVQGRYFIPIIPLLIILFLHDFKIKNNDKKILIYQVFYYCVIYVYMFIIILKRYWI